MANDGVPISCSVGSLGGWNGKIREVFWSSNVVKVVELSVRRVVVCSV
jgi:hypothetical protein